MSGLQYIIVTCLPRRQKKILEGNLKADGADSGTLRLVTLADIAELHRFPAEESIFISGEKEHLKAASWYGMAVLSYLTPGETDYPPADMYAEGLEEVDAVFLRRVYERRHGLPWLILETKRCVVRELALSDLDDLFRLYAWEGMTDYIEPLYEYEAEKEYQRNYIKYMYGFYGCGMWLVIEKSTGQLIGRVGVEPREELSGEWELGYAVGTPYQRKGYATEVCKAVLSYVKEHLEAEHINCLIQKGNVPSERLADSLGFSFAQELNINGKIMEKYVRKL